MKSLVIIITKPPFGTIHDAEAVRLANGALSYGHGVTIVLVGDGVLLAKQGQKAEESGWTSLSPLIEKLATHAEVLADAEAANNMGLAQSDLVAGVKLVEGEVILSKVAGSERTAVF